MVIEKYTVYYSKDDLTVFFYYLLQVMNMVDNYSQYTLYTHTLMENKIDSSVIKDIIICIYTITLIFTIFV